MTPFLEELAARRRFGMKPGLETIRALCDALGNPQRSFKAIHVAGTNGKGAVCAILDAALREGIRDRGSGIGVGRYTSPHLVKINERFFLDGAPVDDETLEGVACKIASSVSRLPSSVQDLTFFEALTAVAFLLYAEAKVDYAILECGLGGRLDATNICEPKLCVITKIGLDHCDWLGDTVEKIAAEKAGIIKPGVPVVLGRNEPSVRAVVEARAKEVDAPFYYAPDLASENEIPGDFSLAGSFNRENAVTALAALKVIEQSNNRIVLPCDLAGAVPADRKLYRRRRAQPARRESARSGVGVRGRETEDDRLGLRILRRQRHRRGVVDPCAPRQEGLGGEDQESSLAFCRRDCGENACCGH